MTKKAICIFCILLPKSQTMTDQPAASGPSFEAFVAFLRTRGDCPRTEEGLVAAYRLHEGAFFKAGWNAAREACAAELERRAEELSRLPWPFCDDAETLRVAARALREGEGD